MNDIKAKQTEYNGYLFRSRLEARWAVFFDVGRIEYEYETEGLQTPFGLSYLPDFYLPRYDLYVECKRNTEDGRKEIVEKSIPFIGRPGGIKQLLILSDIPEGRSPDGGIWHFPILYCDENGGVISGWWFFHDYTEFTVGGNISKAKYFPPSIITDISSVTDRELSKNDERRSSYWSLMDSSFQELRNSATFAAYKNARQARFEYGEKG